MRALFVDGQAMFLLATHKTDLDTPLTAEVINGGWVLHLNNKILYNENESQPLRDLTNNNLYLLRVPAYLQSKSYNEILIAMQRLHDHRYFNNNPIQSTIKISP